MQVQSANDWRVPAWQIDSKNGNSQLQTKLAALAAPLPAPGTTASNASLQLKIDATNGSGPKYAIFNDDASSPADDEMGKPSSAIQKLLMHYCQIAITLCCKLPNVML